MSGREFEVESGATTGYTGRLVAAHLLNTYGAAGDLAWAMGGRSAEKLAQVRAEIGGPESLPLIVANADDAASLDALVQAAPTVIISTVGPYQLYGSSLVAACAAAGTDYVDLTGESNWIAAMLTHEAAAKSLRRGGSCSPAASIPSPSTSGSSSPRKNSRSALAPMRPACGAACGG